MSACKTGRNLLSWVCVLLISSGSVESLNWTAQPLNLVETTEEQEVSLTWNYTLTADEQTDSQTFFKVTWRKFNLGISSFDEFAHYLKITGSSPSFNEPNAPRIVVDRSIGTSSAKLQFKDIRLEDEGIYKMEVSVKFPGTPTIAEHEFNLSVVVAPRIANVSNYQVVCEGSLVTLSCNATGIPPPNITWTRVEDDGTDSAPLLPVVDGKYVLSNIQRSANGTYRCTADNGVGVPFNRTVSVKVKYSPAVERIVNLPNSVSEGQSFNMTCVTSGYPEANVYWIEENNGARINGSVLTFTNISRNDSGQYRCEAKNDCGSNSSVQSIEVFYPPTKGPYLAIVRAPEGTQVTLSCPVDGRPEPNITWYKGNDTTAEAQYQGREWTLQAASNDAGWYSCSAKNFLNPFKPVNVSFQLIVEQETSTASPTKQSQVDYSAQVTLRATPYLPVYDNLSSAPAQKLVTKFVAEMDKLYENDTNYIRTEVTNFSRGSVIVSFVVYFATPVSADKGLSKLKDAVDNNIKLGNFTVEALKIIQPVNPTTAASSEGSTSNPSKSSQKDGPPWPIIGGVIGAVVVVIIIIIIVACWVHNKRKCRRKDTKIHNSESEVLHGQNDIEDGANARVNGGYDGRYADSGPPSANGANKIVQQPQPQPEQQQQQAAAAPPAYAVVDKSKKKKQKAEAEDPYAEVEDPKKDKKTANPSTHDYAVVNKSKKKKKEEDENAYATVDKSKKSKKGQQKPKAPGEVLYADLGDFQPVQPLPTVSTSPEPLGPLKRATPYQGTEYADITQFLKGNATLPEGQSTEMQPTYANAGGGQEAANKENANKGGEGDIEPKETPM